MRRTRLARSPRIVWLVILAACESPAVAPGGAPVSAQPDSVSSAVPASAPASAPAPAQAPPTASVNTRALFDAALQAELDGDALEARDRWIALAAQAPDTPHGRYAQRALGGGDTLTLLAAAGVLSAIAVPSFMGYQQRAKTSEATMNLRRAFDGSVAYFSSERVEANGVVLPPRFPESTPLTPARTACVDGQPTPHLPDPALWEAPGWQALGFTVDDPFYYQYQYVAEGEGPTARFTVRAIGDLDCDGILSTFERTAVVDENGNVNGGAGIYTHNETE